MGMSVRYIGAKGDENIITCDQCGKEINVHQWENAYMLHKVPLVFPPREYITEVYTVHINHFWEFIELHNIPCGDWWGAPCPQMRAPLIEWSKIDLNQGLPPANPLQSPLDQQVQQTNQQDQKETQQA